MVLAFTGTRQGATEQQLKTAILHLSLEPQHYILNGACEGADRAIHGAILDAGLGGKVRFEFWPSNEEQNKWALKVLRPKDLLFGIEKPLKRNNFMINRAEGLMAMPKGYREALRSGTWATIRYARKIKKPVTIVWPNGTFVTET